MKNNRTVIPSLPAAAGAARNLHLNYCEED